MCTTLCYNYLLRVFSGQNLLRAEITSESSLTPLITRMGVCQKTSEILWEQRREKLNSDGGRVEGVIQEKSVLFKTHISHLI